MGLLQWIAIILSIIGAPTLIWTMIALLRGFGKGKPLVPTQDKPHRFAVVVCARNEEAVIGNLLASLDKQDYAGGHKVFVVADNCTDNTAGVAREQGAIVFERTNDKERGKGYALQYGLKMLLAGHASDYDAVCVFDADNLADPSFLTEMNNALNTGAHVAYGYRDSKNIHDSWVSEVYALYWLMLMRFFHCSRHALGLNAIVGGTGFAFRLSALDKQGWKTYSLTEDIEFSIQQTLAGHKIVPVRKAVFYDEQPIEYNVSVKQRMRWMIGHIQCLPIYLPQILKGLFQRKKNHLDMLMYIFFIPMMALALPINVVSFAAALNSPITQPFALPGMVVGIVVAAIVMWIVAYATIKLEHRPVRPMARAIAVYPFFMLTMMFLALASLIRPKTEWVPIAHTSKSTIQDIQKTRNIKAQ